MEQSIIECIGRQESTDKNGKPYIRLFFRNWKFQEFFNPMNGEKVYIQEHSVVGSINQYIESYTSSKRPDPHYMCKVGDFITGAVVQRPVEPYKTEKGFTINYYNAVVFGDSTLSSWEDKIRTAFSKNGVKLLPSTEHKTFDVTQPEETPVDTEETTKYSSIEARKAAVLAARDQNLIADIRNEDINF